MHVNSSVVPSVIPLTKSRTHVTFLPVPLVPVESGPGSLRLVINSNNQSRRKGPCPVRADSFPGIVEVNPHFVFVRLRICQREAYGKRVPGGVGCSCGYGQIARFVGLDNLVRAIVAVLQSQGKLPTIFADSP